MNFYNAIDSTGSVVLTRLPAGLELLDRKSYASVSLTETESGSGTDLNLNSRETTFPVDNGDDTVKSPLSLPLPPGITPKKIRVIRKHKVEVLVEAAVKILEGKTFQQVSEKFDVPKTTLRDFMVRRGLLRRGMGFQLGGSVSVSGPTTRSLSSSKAQDLK